MATTRTLNPLPFEHLDPKRFEDLVRQLLYDFRRWRILETTGRSGADEGFDARGVEAVSQGPNGGDTDSQEEPSIEDAQDRLWLIQCKREKSIGPQAILAHLDAIPSGSIQGLHGLIFAAACDFSKKTRDACIDWCRNKGIQEVYVWGKGEIEDQLFQPKNDNLLFAYFGISLQIRKQSAATKIRRGVTLKRKIRKIQEQGGWPGSVAIIRDPADDRYPSIGLTKWNAGDYLWRPALSVGAGVHGLRLVLRQHYAYYNGDNGEWDFATGYNNIYPQEAEQLWPAPSSLGVSDAILELWRRMPRKHQFHFRLLGTLPYHEITEIDLEPDDFCKFPTVFATFRTHPGGGFEPPLSKAVDVQLEGSGQWHVNWNPRKHVRVFPPELRDQEWESEWSERNGFPLSENSILALVDPKIAEILDGAARD